MSDEDVLTLVTVVVPKICDGKFRFIDATFGQAIFLVSELFWYDI